MILYELFELIGYLLRSNSWLINQTHNWLCRLHIPRFMLSISIGSRFHSIPGLDSILGTKLIRVASVLDEVRITSYFGLREGLKEKEPTLVYLIWANEMVSVGEDDFWSKRRVGKIILKLSCIPSVESFEKVYCGPKSNIICLSYGPFKINGSAGQDPCDYGFLILGFFLCF